MKSTKCQKKENINPVKRLDCKENIAKTYNRFYPSDKPVEKGMKYLESNEMLVLDCMAHEYQIREAITIAVQSARKEILTFIETQRDKGNMVCGGFSAGLCLSDLIKKLKGE